MLLLDAFNKDRASLPQPLPNPPPLAPLPVANPDARTQELINEKLKKAEDLGKLEVINCFRLHFRDFGTSYIFVVCTGTQMSIMQMYTH